ncbi:hypothetical protein [Myxococcus sp. CA040A]|uniref:hypothetical protein n=1 Tax=Myxococcus sp. CA040A TaxID=2741738 RepID=UPI00157B8678|nr:hypothetical protein [Myxococcus sp. CA040A]NTX07031.1 hypothetical protein [Myxococcus sp. CA040A]
MAQKKGLVREGVEVAIATTASQIAGPAGAATARWLMNTLFDLRRDRFDRRAEQFVKEFMGSGYPDETAQMELKAMLEGVSLPVKGVILDSMRQLEDVVSDEVIPALALLTREYARAGRPKDRFYASLVRVLRDIEDGEYAPFRRLVAAVVKAGPNSTSGKFHISKIEDTEKEQFFLSATRGVTHAWEEPFGALMRSVVANELAMPAVGFALQIHEKDGWVAQPEPWLRMAELLRVA